MAKAPAAKPDETPDGETASSGGGMKKIILFAAIVLLAVGGSVAGTWVYLQSSQPAPEAASAEPEAPAPASTKALYYNMRPAFVVNFMAGDKARLLQTEITVMSRDPRVMDAVVTHGPLVRNKLINLLADQDYLEMQTLEGKQALRVAAKNLINTTVDQEEGVTGVESVLFTNFVMQ